MSKRLCSTCGQELDPGALRCSNGHFQKTAKRPKEPSQHSQTNVRDEIELNCGRCERWFRVTPAVGEVLFNCPKCQNYVSLPTGKGQLSRAREQSRRGRKYVEDDDLPKTTAGWQVMAISQALHIAIFVVASFWTIDAFGHAMASLFVGGPAVLRAGMAMMIQGIIVGFALTVFLLGWGAYGLWGIETFGRSIAITSQVLIDGPLACWFAATMPGQFDNVIVATPFLCLIGTFMLVGSDDLEISMRRFYIGAGVMVAAHVVLVIAAISVFF